MPRVGGYEAMLWVDGMPKDTFATKIVVTRHGNHYCDMLCAQADPARLCWGIPTWTPPSFGQLLRPCAKMRAPSQTSSV